MARVVEACCWAHGERLTCGLDPWASIVGPSQPQSTGFSFPLKWWCYVGHRQGVGGWPKISFLWYYLVGYVSLSGLLQDGVCACCVSVSGGGASRGKCLAHDIFYSGLLTY